MNKNFKIFGFRGSMIGDQIMTLPILNFLERQYPGSYKYFQIARKFSQAVPLYLNHPLIDKIIISDCDEGMGPKDKEIAAQCHLVFDVMPNHPMEHDWPNYRNIYEETWVMAGLPLAAYRALPADEQRPKLVPWFDIPRQSKPTIGVWPCAGYGMEGKRHPTKGWYDELIKSVNTHFPSFQVLQFGHPNDFRIEGATDMRHEPFFDQIKKSVGCDVIISTDSGSGLILGAYGVSQISLLTNHFPGHHRNLTAFAPNNLRNHNLVGVNNPDNINIQDVITILQNLSKSQYPSIT